MVYQTVFEYTNQTNATGISGVLGYVTSVSPLFSYMLLFSLFIILLLGSYFSEKRTTGRGDILNSFAVASIVTAVVSIIMYMINPPIIDGVTVGVCIVLAIIGVSSIFTSSER